MLNLTTVRCDRSPTVSECSSCGGEPCGAMFPIDILWEECHASHNHLMERRMAASLDLLQGTLDLLVLRTLSWGPMHGYSVARAIKERSKSVFLVEEGALYPALHRLERKGWVESEWGVSENNRKAKFY